jgi:hypothetical protein
VDGSALTLYLDALDPDVASEGGTSVAPALQMGGELLGTESSLADRVLVVFTDGEAHDSLGAALAVAQRLGHRRIHVILVAEGGREPVRIPRRDERARCRAISKTRQGREIGTRRRDDMLDAVADAAHGTIVAAELRTRRAPCATWWPRTTEPLDRVEHLARPATRVGPLLGAVVILLGQALSRRTAALLGLLCALSLADTPAAHAQAPARRRSAAERAWDRGDSAAARDAYLAELGLRCLVCQVGLGELTVEGVPTRGNDDMAWFNAGPPRSRQVTWRPLVARSRTLPRPSIRMCAFGPCTTRACLPCARRKSTASTATCISARPNGPTARHRCCSRTTSLGEVEPRARAAAPRARRRLEPASPVRWLRAGQPPEPPPTPRATGQAMTQAQAEEILRSIGREELRTRRDRTGRVRRVAEPRVKDW